MLTCRISTLRSLDDDAWSIMAQQTQSSSVNKSCWIRVGLDVVRFGTVIQLPARRRQQRRRIARSEASDRLGEICTRISQPPPAVFSRPRLLCCLAVQYVFPLAATRSSCRDQHLCSCASCASLDRMLPASPFLLLPSGAGPEATCRSVCVLLLQ